MPQVAPDGSSYQTAHAEALKSAEQKISQYAEHTSKKATAKINTEVGHLRRLDESEPNGGSQFKKDIQSINSYLHSKGHLPDISLNLDDHGQVKVCEKQSVKKKSDSSSGKGNSGSHASGSGSETGGGSSPEGQTSGGSGSTGGASGGGSGEAAAAAPSTGGDGGTAAPATINGQEPGLTSAKGEAPENAKAIYSYLVSIGLSPKAAAGIVGNIAQESGGNPESSGDGGDGLIGWTPGIPLTGNAQQDLATQLTKLKQYIDTNGSVADINSHASSPAAAAAYFMSQYERPAVATENASHREEAANATFSLYGSSGSSKTA